MDTVAPSISVSQLRSLSGTARWPWVLDVRRDSAFTAEPVMVAGAVRLPSEDMDRLAAELPPGAAPVCYCVHGHEVSRAAAGRLRALGFEARFLEGGLEAWRASGAPTVAPGAALALAPDRPSTWVTRERPKIDRIACPWLIRRFIDPRARFLYVPAPEVLEVARERGAIAFDIPGAPVEHDGELCSFDTLLRAVRLREPALEQLAVIVRGADTARLDLAPQSAGLLAVSLGLSHCYADDHRMLEHGMVLYDALYAWCRHVQGETHRWTPAP
jgi:rhodanese-related sulfurtransferase